MERDDPEPARGETPQPHAGGGLTGAFALSAERSLVRDSTILTRSVPISYSPKILTRKSVASPYPRAMTAEVILQKGVRYDRGGKPLEVVIPYEEFVDFIESNGLDLSAEEKDSIREAKADREAGRMDQFVSLEDLEKELGI
jgi:hypothetical protein